MAIDEKVLIERLEESKKKTRELYGKPRMEYFVLNGIESGVDKAIEIVKDLASEHNNDICEWKYDGTIYDRCPHKETLFARIHNCNEKIFKFCPYCGKKIKVVPAPYRKGE